MNELGKIIKSLRINAHESQQDLADYLNISFQSVSKWENDIAKPDITMLKKLANHYNVTIDYLLDNDLETPLKEEIFNIKLNNNSSFTIFTDTNDNPNIATSNKSYHRLDNNESFKASDNPNKVILAINKLGKIIYASQGLGYGYGSPSDTTYFDGYGTLASKECFILGKNFVPFKNRFLESSYDKYEKIVKEYQISLNTYSTFAIFTDFKVNDTIATNSYSEDNRHRCLETDSYKVSTRPDDIIIVIDKNQKIIYMSSHVGYGYGTPSDEFYHACNNKNELIEQCFILKDNFRYYQKGLTENEYCAYEFVIPKNGMIIIGNLTNKDFSNFLQDISYQQYNTFFFNNPTSYSKIPQGFFNFNSLSLKENKLILKTINLKPLHFDYEFVVPKNGFVISGDPDYYDFLVFLSILFDNKYSLEEIKQLVKNNYLFEYKTINGQFNKFTLKVKNQQLVVTRPFTDKEILINNLSKKNNLDIDNLANILEERIYNKILNRLNSSENLKDIYCQIADLECEILDLKAQISDWDDEDDD